MRRVGFFGGTFDPPHRGHLEPARCAAAALGLDAVVFVPAGSPPHKQGEPVTSFGHRFAMAVLATRDEPGFLVSDLEAARRGPTYTVDSVPLLCRAWPAEQAFFILGSDSFVQITTWHRWVELVDLIHLVVLHRDTSWGTAMLEAVPSWVAERVVWARPGQTLAVPETGPHRIVMVEHPPIVAAASDLRASIQAGECVAGLVPDAVLDHIAKYRLYR